MSRDTLGDRIRARRQERVDSGGPARAVVLDSARTYTENLRDVLRGYVDNQLDIAKTYVDNQIASARAYVDTQVTAARAVSKTYVDNQLAAKIAKLAVDNNLINNP